LNIKITPLAKCLNLNLNVALKICDVLILEQNDAELIHKHLVFDKQNISCQKTKWWGLLEWVMDFVLLHTSQVQQKISAHFWTSSCTYQLLLSEI